MTHRGQYRKVECRQSRCKNDYFPDKWGNMEAQRLGWFLQKSGDAWCPNHVPDWVAEWRKKKKAEGEK